MSDDDFGGREVPLIPGELYGVRGFKIDEDGKLAPLHKMSEMRYTSDVHVAECDMRDTYVWQFKSGHSSSPMTITNPIKSIIHKVEPVPSKDCDCGFYAYFDASEPNVYMHGFDGKHVTAIVRASGRCIVGAKGFRAEKMQIVGLVCDYPTLNLKSRFHTTMMEIADGLSESNMPLVVTLAVVNVLAVFLHEYIDNKWTAFLANSTALMMYCAFFVMLTTLVYCVWFLKQDIKTDIAMPKKELVKKIKEQYPDIALFATVEDAQERFPLSKASDLPT